MTEPLSKLPEKPERSLLFGVSMVLLALASWTVAPLMVKAFTGRMDAWTQNGWRYSIAAVVWLPALFVSMKRGQVPKRVWKAAGIVAACNFVGQIAFTNAFYYTNPAMVTFGLRVQIVVVVLLAALLFPAERVVLKKPLFIAGMLAVIIGTVTMALLGKETAKEVDEGFVDRPLLGFTLAALAGAGYAAYAVAVRKCMHGVNSTTSFSAISLLTAAGLVPPMLLLATSPESGEHDFGMAVFTMPTGWIVLFVASALIGIAFGHVVFYVAIRRLGVAVATGVIQVQPFLVAVVSYFWFDEVLSLGQWAAGSFAVVGAVTIVAVQHIVTQRAKRAELLDVERAIAEANG